MRTKLLPQILKVTTAIASWARAGGVETAINAIKAGFSGKSGSEVEGYGGALQTVIKIFGVVGTVFRAVKSYATQFFAALKTAAPFFQNILGPLLLGFAKGVLGGIVLGFKLVLFAVKLIAPVLGWLGEKARPLKGIFEGIGMVLGFIFGPGLILKVGKAIGGILGWVLKLVGGIGTLPGRLLGFGKKAVTSFWNAIKGLPAKIGGLIRKIPATLVRAGSAALAAFLTFGQDIISKIIEGIKKAPGKIMDAIGGLLPDKIGNALGIGNNPTDAGARGGTTRAGVSLVGERGPELVRFPAGVRVQPMQNAGAPPALGGAGGASRGGRIEVPVFLNRRQIALAVADDVSDSMARA